MSRYLILLFALCSCTAIHAQSYYYYDDALKATTKKNASRCATIIKTDSGYDAKVFNMANMLLFTARYISLPTDLSQGRNGEYITYYTKGTIYERGTYENNLRTGTWKDYTYEKGALATDSHYDHDSLDGPYVHYHFETGVKTTVGQYVNGCKEGIWKYCTKDGSMINETAYSKGKVVRVKRYDAEKNVIKALMYKDSVLVAVRAYDSAGNQVAYAATREDSSINGGWEQMPEPSVNIPSYLATTLRYPDAAKENLIQGRVVVKFIVDEEGNVKEVHVKRSVAPVLDREAMRVVGLMPKWKPGYINGIAVPVYFNMPIVFKLE